MFSLYFALHTNHELKYALNMKAHLKLLEFYDAFNALEYTIIHNILSSLK